MTEKTTIPQFAASDLREKADRLSEKLRAASTLGNTDHCYRELCDACHDAMSLRDELLIFVRQYRDQPVKALNVT